MFQLPKTAQAKSQNCWLKTLEKASDHVIRVPYNVRDGFMLRIR